MSSTAVTLSDLRRLTETLPVVLRGDLHDSILDALPVGIWRSDRDGQCKYANRQLYTMMGQTPESMMGVGWLDGIHPDDRKYVASVWDVCVRLERAFEARYRYISMTGRITLCDVWAARHLDGWIGVAIPMAACSASCPGNTRHF